MSIHLIDKCRTDASSNGHVGPFVSEAMHISNATENKMLHRNSLVYFLKF